MESKPKRNGAGGIAGVLPIPRTLGSFIILVMLLAFTAGKLRNELALTLLGTVFLTILAYCFFGVFFLGILHRRKARLFSMAVVSETVSAGKEGELLIKTRGGAPLKKNQFWKFPAILIRCEFRIETKDGRVIRHYTDPGIETYSRFPVNERGAYYGDNDKLVIFDAPGFFRLSLPVGNPGPAEPHDHAPQGGTPRLLAFPRPVEESIRLPLKSGGTEQRTEPHYRKSDELTDHRPYVPGDDPRRINWKLYGHAPLGELFVREGEPEPPPRSRLLILLDTEADQALYTVDEGRRAVDLLCESALAAALEFSAQGMDILIGYTGGKISGGKEESGPLNAAELASALAWPAAIFTPGPAKAADNKKRKIAEPHEAAFRAVLPKAPDGMAVLIMALPRSSAGSSALDLFLKDREAGQSADIVFLYDAESRRAPELEENAVFCVNLYNRKSGIHAEKIALKAAREGKSG